MKVVILHRNFITSFNKYRVGSKLEQSENKHPNKMSQSDMTVNNLMHGVYKIHNH